MTPYMSGKLAPNRTHFTRGLVKYVPRRGYFYAVPSQNRVKFATSLTPPTVERRYEWLRMPQGAAGAPAWFVSVMRLVTSGLNNIRMYLDDAIGSDDSPITHVAT